MTMNNLSTTVSYPTLDDFDATLLEFSMENSTELFEEYEGSEHPYGLRYGIWTTIALRFDWILRVECLRCSITCKSMHVVVGGVL